MADWRIWKYQVPWQYEFELSLPEGFRLLHVGTQGIDGIDEAEQLCFWVLHDLTQPKFTVRFVIYGTGHLLAHDPMNLWHMETVQVGKHVWHVFAVTRPILQSVPVAGEVTS